MTSSLLNKNLINFLIITIFLVNLVKSYDCPEYCDCTVLYHKHTEPTYTAKCTNLSGLKSVIAGKKSSINSIDLSDLNLRRFSLNLENFKNLTDLDLSNNHLTELNKLNKRIIKLNISYNQLESTKLTKIPEFVHHLDLSHNELTYIPRDLMSLTRLRSLELTGNPINCNCETIEVRNWLQENHVWSDRHVICSTPIQYRNMSWLQVKQSEVCDSNKKHGVGYLWSTSTDEDDESMLGDAPHVFSGEGSAEEHDETDGVDEEFIAVKDHKSLKSDSNEESGSTNGVFESSGLFHAKSIIDGLLDDGGSGSGDDGLEYSTPQYDEDETKNISMFFSPPGIFIESTSDDGELVSKIDYNVVQGRPTNDGDDADKGNIAAAPAEETKTAGNEEDFGVWILLAIVFLLFIGLMIFVIMKRRKRAASLKRYDPESAQKSTELKPMNKNNIGKPVESVPLMPAKEQTRQPDAVDHPVLSSFKPRPEDEPLLENKPPNGDIKEKSPSKLSLYENLPEVHANNNNNNIPNGNGTIPNGHDSTPVPATRTHVPLQQSSPVHNNFDHPHMDSEHPPSDSEIPVTSLPSSPILERANARYSPVYQPETGRVKIRTSMTPRPKTPLIVNRTKSDAGDIVTTPQSPNTRISVD